MELAKDFRVNVFTAPPNKGHSPEQITEMCLNEIMHVSKTAHPVIREQAEAHRSRMEKVILRYVKKAINSDRTTVYNALKDAGQTDLAEAIRKL